MRSLKSRGALQSPVEVIILGGVYQLDRPLVFRVADSGTAQCPITYTAEPGACVTISGGQELAAIREVVREGRRIWIAKVPRAEGGIWPFRQLFVDGRRCPRARLPEKGFYRIRALPDLKPGIPWMSGRQNRFVYAPGDIRPWKNIRDVEVVALQRWIENRLPIRKVDVRHRLVTFDRFSKWSLTDDRSQQGTLYWVENVCEALRRAGQWYLDRGKHLLYYLPRRSEKLGRTRTVVPRLEQVLRLSGRKNSPVQYLRFKGLTFAHAEWPIPKGWPASAQAAVDVEGAVSMAHASNCRFENCTFEHVGGYAVEIGQGCVENELLRCKLWDLGAGGIKIGHGSMRTTVSDCEVAHGGRIFPSGVGIWIGHSPGNKIVHNHIHDFFYSGVSIGWVWGYAESRAVGNLIEHNHIHDIGHGLLSDMGGIYTLGVSLGTRLRFNLIHDVNGRCYGGWGIYTDEGSSDILIEKNIVYRCSSAPFHQHYGRDNQIENNIFAFGRRAQVERSRIEPHSSFTFRRNIVYYVRGKLLGGRWNPPNCHMDHNLYWWPSRKVTFDGRPLAEWQRLGMDIGSLVADPLFVDAAAGDLRLRTGSPAAKIGFEAIDLSDIGPRCCS